MTVKNLILVAIPLTIALMATGYARYLWNLDQQRCAAAREAAELRYAQEIELKCRVGEISDVAQCTKARAYLNARVASTE
jgi:hypothetical protein